MLQRRRSGAKADIIVLALGVAGKNLQPPWFEQSHAHDVLVFVADADVVEKAEHRPFPNAFAVQPGLAHQLFHLEFARFQVKVLAADDSHRLVAHAFTVKPGSIEATPSRH